MGGCGLFWDIKRLNSIKYLWIDFNKITSTFSSNPNQLNPTSNGLGTVSIEKYPQLEKR